MKFHHKLHGYLQGYVALAEQRKDHQHFEYLIVLIFLIACQYETRPAGWQAEKFRILDVCARYTATPCMCWFLFEIRLRVRSTAEYRLNFF